MAINTTQSSVLSPITTLISDHDTHQKETDPELDPIIQAVAEAQEQLQIVMEAQHWDKQL